MRVLANMLGVKAGGARTYLVQMLQHLATTPQPHEYVVLGGLWLSEYWASVQGREKGSVRIVARDVPAPRRLWFDQVELPRIVVREGCDRLWSPNNYASLRSPVPQIVMVCNPVYFSDRYRTLLHRHGTPTEVLDYHVRQIHARVSATHADVAVFPTSAFMQHVLERLGPSAIGRAHALHHGYDSTAPARVGHGSADGRITIFYPTSWAPHKNFSVLFDAAEILACRHVAFELWLTVAGDERTYAGPYRRWLQSDFAHLRAARDRVRWLGYLTPSQVLDRYAAADVVVFPSWLETFGYPLAEARAAGVPLVAADTPTNREVAGDAAEYHEPFDAEALADRIQRAAQRRSGTNHRSVTSWSAHFAALGRLLEMMA